MALQSAATRSVSLASGSKVPAVGYGVGTKWFKKRDGDASQAAADEISQDTVAAVQRALAAGYTHIDEAEMYNTETEAGIAITSYLKEHNVPRDKLFVTTKVYAGLADVRKTLQTSLSQLGLSYVDLYLIHAPFKPEIDLQQTWRAMEGLVDEGLARNIGVSNFFEEHLDEVLAIARIKPAVNQYERHPYLQQPELLKYCEDRGILVEAYSPLLTLSRKPGGPVDPVVEAIAKEINATPAQVLLAWAAACGTVPVTTTSNTERMTEFLEVFREGSRIQLTDEQRDRISQAGASYPYRQFWQKEADARQASKA